MNSKNTLAVLAVALVLTALSPASARAALIGHFVHDYSSVVITLDVYDNQPGGRYLWQYTVSNISYDPNPGTTNGFSGFETYLPTPIPEIADIIPNAGTVPAWDVNCCSGNPVEWDRTNTDGNGVMPGEVGVFSFTTNPRQVAINNDGWFHSWVSDSQTNIISTPGMHVPLVEGFGASSFRDGPGTDLFKVWSDGDGPAAPCLRCSGTGIRPPVSAALT